MPTVEVVRLPNGLPSVQADAHADRLLRCLVVLGEAALDGDGAPETTAGAPEYEHEAVPDSLYLSALVGLHLLTHEGVVVTQELHPARVAQALSHRGGALDVGEEDGDSAVGSHAAEVGPFSLDACGDDVDRGCDLDGVNALSPHLVGQYPLHPARGCSATPVGVEGGIERFDAPVALPRRQEDAAPKVQRLRLIPGQGEAAEDLECPLELLLRILRTPLGVSDGSLSEGDTARKPAPVLTLSQDLPAARQVGLCFSQTARLSVEKSQLRVEPQLDEQGRPLNSDP